jgi:hypothetical protein
VTYISIFSQHNTLILIAGIWTVLHRFRRHPHTCKSILSCSVYAYEVLDSDYKWDLTDEEAQGKPTFLFMYVNLMFFCSILAVVPFIILHTVTHTLLISSEFITSNQRKPVGVSLRRWDRKVLGHAQQNLNTIDRTKLNRSELTKWIRTVSLGDFGWFPKASL